MNGGEVRNFDFIIGGNAFNYLGNTEFKAVVTSGIPGFNDSVSKNVSVNETKDLNLFFAPINAVNFNTAVSNNVQFMEDTYPVKDNGIKVSLGAPISAPPLPTTEAGINDVLEEIKKKLLEGLAIAKQNNKEFIGAAGIVPEGYLDILNASGVNIGGGVILIDENQIKTTAHEVGHTFNFCEEYSSSLWSQQNSDGIPCPNGDLDKNGSLDAICLIGDAGCPISTLPPLYNYTSITVNTTLRNFMGSADALPSFESWVSNDSYNALLVRNDKTSNFTVKEIKYEPFSGEYMVVKGTLSNSNVFTISPYYKLKGGFINNQSLATGGYSFKFLDSNNQVVSSYNFEPQFFYTGENGTIININKTFVLFAVPTNDSVTKIQIKNGTILINEINKTQNTPSIMINNSLENTTITGFINLTLTSLDADNDTLHYAVVLNRGNGTNITLEVYLNQSVLNFNFSNITEGNDYFFEVLATDGFNTNSTESGRFCVDHDLSVCGLKLLKKNQTTTIFEFNIMNSLNQTLTNVNWTLSMGDNNTINSTIPFNLTSKESIFVFIEYNYLSIGNYSVLAIANAGNLSDSQSINITI